MSKSKNEKIGVLKFILSQQASYLEGGPLMWMLPLYLHVNKKSDYDIMIIKVASAGQCSLNRDLFIYIF